MTTEKAANPVRTAQMTFRIVESIERLGGATLTEISTHLDEPKSTVHNHLSTLLEEEYLTRQGNEYNLGLRFAELGERSKSRLNVYAVGRTEVDNLANETGELANLATEEHGQAVYLHCSRGADAISTDTNVGRRVPLHATALGKAILANYPQQHVRNIIEAKGLPRETEHTITDEAEFLEELATIREDGIAYDDQERAIGIRCVAAPIMDQEERRSLGALSVTAPMNRMQDNRFKEEIPQLLRRAANVIEIELEYGDERSLS